MIVRELVVKSAPDVFERVYASVVSHECIII